MATEDDVEEQHEVTEDEGFGRDGCTSILKKHFKEDISTTFWHVDWDITTVNYCITYHLYHQGLFEVGDLFVHEVQLDATAMRATFLEIHRILAAMESGDLEPALAWAAAHSDDQLPKFKANEFEQLRGCLALADQVDQSLYARFMSLTQRRKLAEELAKQLSILSVQPYQSPLNVLVTAGGQALPPLLDMVEGMHAQDWQTIKDLPELTNLTDEFSFHPVFACPITYEHATERNPPFRLACCGRVIWQKAIEGIMRTRSVNASVKCPLCDKESNESKKIFF
ncbi:putative protein RMD5 [Cocos nucifera]|uniref:CTLH/CRA C-terminal to LisH motif domain-containing protein n=1 Tax=Cocos nucifera TaxID=13894 RepID=A0A8K0I9G3_COCNU|nr:putative protein RMD5 [Cocos nucifera]